MKEYKYTINGTKYEVQIGDIEENIATVTVNGEEYKVEMEKEAEPEKKKVVVKPAAAQQATSNDAPAKGNVNTANALKAPLPGVVTEIKVAVGDEVKEGDTVVVLEAMKMANNLDAEKSGKITAILVNVGDSVMEDTPLVVIE
jgi:biotin carboxyl carrier protein